MLRVVVVQFGARRERCSAFPSWWHCWHACAVERALQRWRVMLLAVRGIVGVYVQWNWRCSADMSCCLPCVVALLVPVYCGTCAAALVCRVANSTSRRGVPHASSSFVALIVFFMRCSANCSLPRIMPSHSVHASTRAAASAQQGVQLEPCQR